MANVNAQKAVLPEDQTALRVLVQSLLQEREQHQHWVETQRQQTAQLQAEILRLQVELERYKKWYYGPRADRLRTPGELAQLLLNFAEELDRKPVSTEDREPFPKPNEELRRVQRRPGRRDLARFENLPVPPMFMS